MILSKSHRFIFVHIYKTAGTSVMAAFLPHARLVDRMAFEFRRTSRLFIRINGVMGWNDDGMKQYTGFHKHATAAEIRRKMGKVKFARYYRFAFVRNPYDLLVSLYYYIKQSPRHKHHDVATKLDFKQFLKWHIGENPPNQVDFVSDPATGEVLVDDIGRFETLESDIKRIRRRVGLGEEVVVSHKNKSVERKKRDFRDYFDEESRTLVADHFRRDLEGLGYSFWEFQSNVPILSVGRVEAHV